jgi:hypothetical protein
MLVALPPAVLPVVLYMNTVATKFSNDLRKRLSIDTAAVLAFLLFFVWPVRQDAAAEHAAAVTRASELAARTAVLDKERRQREQDQAKERRQREQDQAAWLEALRTGDRHRPPGMVPPLLRVTDHGHQVIVENISGKPLYVALALVQKDAPDERWLRCGMYYQPSPHAPKEDFPLIPVGGHKLYVPQQSCVLAFEDAVIEYRVGSGPGEPTWWSDSAVAAPAGRDSDFLSR